MGEVAGGIFCTARSAGAGTRALPLLNQGRLTGQNGVDVWDLGADLSFHDAGHSAGVQVCRRASVSPAVE